VNKKSERRLKTQHVPIIVLARTRPTEKKIDFSTHVSNCWLLLQHWHCAVNSLVFVEKNLIRILLWARQERTLTNENSRSMKQRQNEKKILRFRSGSIAVDTLFYDFIISPRDVVCQAVNGQAK